MEQRYSIREATADDAPFLAETVMEALGHELCVQLAEGEDNLPKVTELFTSLGHNPNSQYSFTNSLISVNELGCRVGAIIAYDGAHLHELRIAFIRAANKYLGWNIKEEEAGNWGDEADKDEIYIDSLYVDKQYRKKGIARRLIEAVANKYSYTGKPLGLLVEPENIGAKSMYEKIGFKEVGISNFFRVPMIHMQKKITD